MTSKKQLDESTVLDLYDVAWRQLGEDRDALLDVYEELRGLIKASPERYAISGETLAKFVDLRIKQTSQIVDLLKVVQKKQSEDEGLSEGDLEAINDEIGKHQ